MKANLALFLEKQPVKSVQSVSMESATGKPALLRNVLTQLLIIGLLIVTVRFAYVITLAGESCTLDDFCFFSSEVRSASVAPTAP
ncbi:uncharacterized protein HKW66_Vig0035210 [Vigna angularis]|uniref:CASP-like protein n=1 Tax=Phaseolus angularis TaxID=3914 RepID=A0A8T0L9F5_PHAAN|nr:uncharacterized protein HKW66_Vig0035210 [Vigna angularis]